MARLLHLGNTPRPAAVAVGALVALLGCARPPPAPEPLALAVAAMPHASLVHLAVLNGDLAREGLDARVERHAFGRPALDALLAGTADVATCAETPVVLATLAGRSVAVVAEISSASAETVLLARRAAIATPRDLAGKRVGVPRGTSCDFFLEVLLVRNLVDRATVRVVDLAPAAMAEALEAGRVDAVVTWSRPARALTERFGDALVTLTAPDVYRETFDVVVRPDLLRDRPEAVRRLLRALIAAERFQRDHPDEAARRVAAALGLPPDEARPAFAPFHFGVWLDQGLVALMEQQARWAAHSGLVALPAAPVDFQEIVRAEPLLAVRPAAVAVLR